MDTVGYDRKDWIAMFVAWDGYVLPPRDTDDVEPP